MIRRRLKIPDSVFHWGIGFNRIFLVNSQKGIFVTKMPFYFWISLLFYCRLINVNDVAIADAEL